MFVTRCLVRGEPSCSFVPRRVEGGDAGRAASQLVS